MSEQRGIADEIIQAVSDERRNSYLRADNPEIRRRLNERFADLQAKLAAAEIKASNLDILCASIKQGPRLLTWVPDEDTYTVQEAEHLVEAEQRAESAERERDVLRALLVESQSYIGGDWRARRDTALSDPQPQAQEPSEMERCPVCDWPLASQMSEGCIPGNCSYRPAQGSEEYRRIQQRRAALQREQPPVQEPSEVERKARAFDFLEHSYPFLTTEDASDIINRHVFRGQVYDSALLAAEAAMQREQEQGTRSAAETEGKR